MIKLSSFDCLTFLDVSYASNVTDHGMIAFREKSIPITKLFVNGLSAITSVGLGDLINCCKNTLKVLEAALMP